jgi:hypothetical protein
MSKNLSAYEVRALLHKKYPAPEWALLEEVRNSTGFATRERYADAVAMSLYPSRGLSVLGFEIKSSRGDWQRELRNPDKSDAIQMYCDRWWIVAGGPNIVQQSEVPVNWGLLVAGGGRLMTVKDAPQLEAQPLDRKFVASLLRKMTEYVDGQLSSSERFQEAFEKGKAAAALDAPNTVRQLERAHESLQKRVAEFEKESGFTIDRWKYGNLIQVLRQVQDFIYGPRPDYALAQARNTLESSLHFIEAMQQVQSLINKGEVEIPPPPRQNNAESSHQADRA